MALRNEDAYIGECKMKRDKKIPDPTPKAFHDLLDKAATTQVALEAVVPVRKGKPALSSVRRAKKTSGA